MAKRTTVPAPMEALLAAELPEGEGWQFEPKWDGFRCLARRDGDEVTLTSKSGKPLGRYFPDVVEMLARPEGEAVPARRRAHHPGRRRALVRGAAASPASGRKPRAQARRGASGRADGCSTCSSSAARILAGRAAGASAARRSRNSSRGTRRRGLHLSPMTPRPRRRCGWLERSGGALDGVIAKRADLEYRSGERAMVKVKQQRTADCVVGGFRYAEKKQVVGSLLLGLYDDEGLLNHVGFTSAIPATERPAAHEGARSADRAARASPAARRAARAAGAPSDRRRWEPLKPELVVEVRYDQVTEPPLPPRHRLPALAAGQGPEAVHLRPARARASAVAAQGAVRYMSLLFDAPLIAGLDIARRSSARQKRRR